MKYFTFEMLKLQTFKVDVLNISFANECESCSTFYIGPSTMQCVPHSDTVLSSVSVRFAWNPPRHLYYFLVRRINPSTIIYHVRYANPEVCSFKAIKSIKMNWSQGWYNCLKNVEISQSSLYFYDRNSCFSRIIFEIKRTMILTVTHQEVRLGDVHRFCQLGVKHGTNTLKHTLPWDIIPSYGITQYNKNV